MVSYMQRAFGRKENNASETMVGPSPQAEDRVREVRTREAILQLRSILTNGGYSERQVEGIVRLVRSALMEGRAPSYDEFFKTLHSLQLSKPDAKTLARNFALTD